jgi:hypothetical protein
MPERKRPAVPFYAITERNFGLNLNIDACSIASITFFATPCRVTRNGLSHRGFSSTVDQSTFLSEKPLHGLAMQGRDGVSAARHAPSAMTSR